MLNFNQILGSQESGSSLTLFKKEKRYPTFLNEFHFKTVLFYSADAESIFQNIALLCMIFIRQKLESEFYTQQVNFAQF